MSDSADRAIEIEDRGAMARSTPGGEAVEGANQPRYQELVPPRPLHEAVVCYWHSRVGPPGEIARVVPDGCIDVIWVDDRPPFVAGPATVPVIHQFAAGTDITGVRFRPGTAHRILGVHAGSLLNQDIPLADIWRRQRCLVWDEPAHQRTRGAKLRVIDAAVRHHLATTDDDPFISHAARWIARHPWRPVGDLDHLSGLSARQIRRRFDEAVGYGPKTLQRIIRLQRLLWLADRSREPRATLAQLALDAGYADQPHMTREVTVLTGLSPGQLLRGAAVACAVSDLFKTPGP